MLPNLVQTTEGAPAIVHCGPFANIAHGTSSVLAQRMGLHLADYVVNETGFAADLGAEKFFDLVMPMCGHVPSAAVVIVTLKALRAQGGSPDGPVEAGFPNLTGTSTNLKRWGAPAVVALNRFAGDSERRSGRRARVLRDTGRGGRAFGGLRQGRRWHDGPCRPRRRGRLRQRSGARAPDLLARQMSLEEKLTAVATKVYGARRVSPSRPRRRPAWSVCRARLRPAAGVHRQDAVLVHRRSQGDGRAPGWTLTITDATLSAGAGFVVAIAGSMMLMPGLGKTPQAQKLDVDDAGHVIGMEY